MAKRTQAPSQLAQSPLVTQQGLPQDAGVKWTVLVFMGADTEAGNAPMYEAAVADLAEMAAVGSGDQLEILVQVHAHGEVRRARIEHDMLPAIRLDGLKALKIDLAVGGRAGGGALKDFFHWAIDRANHDIDDPKHYSMLVLWGHAYDFAIGHAPTNLGAIDALDFVELSDLLRDIQAELRVAKAAKSMPRLSVLAFDACDVATAEMACEFEPFADYLLASQIGVPLPGWPYDAVLGRLRAPFGRVMRPAELGSWIINRYCEKYSERGEVSLSMLDLKRAAELCAHVKVFSEALDAALDRDPDIAGFLSDVFSRSLTEIDKPYVDLADLCLGLSREADDPMVTAAARALGDFLIAPPRGAADARTSTGTGLPFVTANGRVGGETAKLNGVSLYAPHVAPDYDFIGVRRLYERFALSRSTSWSTVVHTLAAIEE